MNCTTRLHKQEEKNLPCAKTKKMLSKPPIPKERGNLSILPWRKGSRVSIGKRVMRYFPLSTSYATGLVNC